MIEIQILTAGVTLAVVAAQIIEDNGDPSLGVQGAVLGAGIGLFVFFDKRERNAVKERNLERRAADEAKDQRIADLEQEVVQLHERMYEILRAHHERPS